MSVYKRSCCISCFKCSCSRMCTDRCADLAASPLCDVNGPNCCADNVSCLLSLTPFSYLPSSPDRQLGGSCRSSEARHHIVIYILSNGKIAVQGLNSRLVPVTGNSTLATLSALFFNTLPAGGGFIATPVNSSGMALSWHLPADLFLFTTTVPSYQNLHHQELNTSNIISP